jgi:hypothetical protein
MLDATRSTGRRQEPAPDLIRGRIREDGSEANSRGFKPKPEAYVRAKPVPDSIRETEIASPASGYPGSVSGRVGTTQQSPQGQRIG